MNIYQKLNAARIKFHGLKLEKTGNNKFAGYKYFELGDFLIQALMVFEEVGLCAVVSFEKETATMTIHDTEVKQMDQGAQSIVITSPMGSAALKGCHEVQNIGAVETYQRRYLWTAALEIVEHDALDATTGADKHKSTSQLVADSVAAGITEDRKNDLQDAALTMIDAFNADNGMAALSVWRQIADQEEKAFLWSLLLKESKLRGFLKANKDTETA